MPAINPTLTAFAAAAPPWSLASLDTNFVNIAAVINTVNSYTQYAADTGAANAYVVTYAAGVNVSLVAGLGVVLKATAANTAGSTLNVGGTGIKNILLTDGSVIRAGHIVAGGIYICIYDGTRYLLLNPSQPVTTFTATLTGVTTTVTGTVTAVTTGYMVNLNLLGFTGTSNTTAKTLTGIPAALQPTGNKLFPVLVSDNGGASVWGVGQITGGTGTITLSPTAAANPAGWTNAGTVTINAFEITYALS